MNSIFQLKKLARDLSDLSSFKKQAFDDYVEKCEEASVDILDVEKERFNNFCQWTTGDGQTFFPASRVVDQLPPGYYDIASSMTGGLFFKNKSAKSEKLLRFPDSESDQVISEIEKFWTLGPKFAEYKIPYKRGIILYGPPGSGKTCILRIAIDNLIKKQNGIVVDFPDPYLFEEGYNILRQIHPEKPLVVLMEDLDAILNRNSESSVLNLLDGVKDIHKAVFLATTNYPEKLGSRILNRPSRFDKKFFIGMPNKEAREMFIRTKLSDDKEIDRWVEDTDGFSIAHIKELFVANKLLGDPYDQALEVLQAMKQTPSSEIFDDYNSKASANWMQSAGSGKPYLVAKKAFNMRKK